MNAVSRLGLLWIAAVGFAATLSGAEIKGKVTRANGETVEVSTDSQWVPITGDRAEIYYNIPGLDEPVHVAAGRVASVSAGAIRITIDRHSGTIERNHLARITSNRPRRRGSVTESSQPLPASQPQSDGRRISSGEAAPRQDFQSNTMFIEEKKTPTPLDAADKITGTVTMGDNRRVSIRSDSKLRANLGDKAEIFSKNAGSNSLTHVAFGHVDAIDGYETYDHISIEIERADRDVAPGQFVLIKSKNPRTRPAN
jgi:hypothetical protein